jgi:hypothetical protein
MEGLFNYYLPYHCHMSTDRDFGNFRQGRLRANKNNQLEIVIASMINVWKA